MLTGLTQQQVADAMGKSQSWYAAYECGRRSPTLPNLERLLATIGLRLEWRISHDAPGDFRMRGPVGLHVREHREDIIKDLATFGLINPRVVGPVAHARERSASDTVEILVDPDTDEAATYEALAAAGRRLLRWVPDLVRVSTPELASQLLIWFEDDDSVPL